MVIFRHPSQSPQSLAVAGKAACGTKLAESDCRILIESVNRDLKSIDDAWHRRDETGLLECIHSLKGALFIVGEHAAANDCGVAEHCIQSKGLESCSNDIECLKASLHRLIGTYSDNA